MTLVWLQVSLCCQQHLSLLAALCELLCGGLASGDADTAYKTRYGPTRLVWTCETAVARQQPAQGVRQCCDAAQEVIADAMGVTQAASAVITFLSVFS